VGRDSVVGIATRYGLDGPGIESPRAYPGSCTMGTESFPEVKWPRRGADLSPPSIVEVKKDLYIRSSSGPSSPLLGWTLRLRLRSFIRWRRRWERQHLHPPKSLPVHRKRTHTTILPSAVGSIAEFNQAPWHKGIYASRGIALSILKLKCSQLHAPAALSPRKLLPTAPEPVWTPCRRKNLSQ
jgi:hypothetical protein